MSGDELVRGYMRSLNEAALALPVDRRDELVGEVRRHIDEALAEAGARDEATVRSVLDRLGTPSEIVAEERDAEAPPDDADVPETEPERRWGSPEVVGVLLVTLGAVVLPIVGPIVGLVFLWPSKVMTRWQKLGAFAVGLFLFFVLILGVFAVTSAGGSGPETLPGPTQLATP